MRGKNLGSIVVLVLGPTLLLFEYIIRNDHKKKFRISDIERYNNEREEKERKGKDFGDPHTILDSEPDSDSEE